MEIQELREQLRSRLVTVTFKKVNGDVREMVCTTCAELIPTGQQVTEEKQRKISQENIRVWEPAVGGWRSFKIENVISAI